jgi:hypothetical protein
VVGIEARVPVAEALEAHRDEIPAETLAVDLVLGAIPDAIIREVIEIDGETATVSLKTA